MFKGYRVYVQDYGNQTGAQALAVAEAQLTFKREQELLKSGFSLLWDSAPTEAAAYEYAADPENSGTPYGAHRRCCTACGNYADVSLYRGKVIDYNNYRHPRFVPFNGYLDEQCANGDDFEVKPVITAADLRVLAAQEGAL